MKSISSLSIHGNTENPLVAACAPDQSVTVKRRKGDYALISVLSTEDFKQKDSVLNTSAITAVTKVSMKPQSGATANRHLRSSEERNGEQR